MVPKPGIHHTDMQASQLQTYWFGLNWLCNHSDVLSIRDEHLLEHFGLRIVVLQLLGN